MEAIELLAKLQANKEELGKMEEKITMIEKEIAMIEKRLSIFVRPQKIMKRFVDQVFAMELRSPQGCKICVYFSSTLFANLDFSELVRGKRYGLFRSDSDFALVVNSSGLIYYIIPMSTKRGERPLKN